jgi:hypothetical protein
MRVTRLLKITCEACNQSKTTQAARSMFERDIPYACQVLCPACSGAPGWAIVELECTGCGKLGDFRDNNELHECADCEALGPAANDFYLAVK